MTDTAARILACVAGMGIGAMYFGGLWWTLRKGLSSPRAALWFVGSFLVRTSIALAGFYLVSGGQLGRLLASLVGFVVARMAVMWLTHDARTSAGARHAP